MCACACAVQLLLWRQACFSSSHAQTIMWHCCMFINKVGGCLSIKWVDQGVVYLFNYPVYSVIRPASGTKMCLSIKWVDQGVVYLFNYPACLWNQNVFINKVGRSRRGVSIRYLACLWNQNVFINKVGGSRCGVSIRHIQLSGLPLEPKCLDNRGCTVQPYICIIYIKTVPVKPSEGIIAN